jgi:hypothetical protein
MNNPSRYITAAQAKQAKQAGSYSAEYSIGDYEVWHLCRDSCEYLEKTEVAGVPLRYRVKQPHHEPSHAVLRAEYAKQVAEVTTRFYLWWASSPTGTWTDIGVPCWQPDLEYRCTDVSCYVSKDGEPPVRMTREDARKLQSTLGNTVEWKHPNLTLLQGYALGFACEGTYTYHTKQPSAPDVGSKAQRANVEKWNGKSFVQPVVEHTPRGDAHYLAQMAAAASTLANAAAARTLAYLGYTYEGGEQWKPPLLEGLSDYERGHEAGALLLLAQLNDLMILWSGVHPSKLSIKSIIAESQK